VPSNCLLQQKKSNGDFIETEKERYDAKEPGIYLTLKTKQAGKD